jgi:hypothetical protein
MNRRLVLCLWPVVILLCGAQAPADDAADSKADPPAAAKYLLRYKFEPGETIRWKVLHQAQVRTTVAGTTQTAETYTESVKVWQIKEVDGESGQITFVHSVDRVEMRQSVSDRQDIRYNSDTDVIVPPEFEQVAKAVRVPLSVIVLDNRGHITKRKEERPQPGANPGEMTVPLPEDEVAVGESWSFPHDANVRQKDGSTKQVQTRQQFTLAAVDNRIATIRVETTVLTPIRDPALEAQLIQHVTDGTVRFDIAAGRVVGQQTDIDKRVVGFQGEASSMHYVTRFTEELIHDPVATAAAKKPAANSAQTAAKGSTDASAPAGDAAAPSADSTAAAKNGQPAAAPAAGTTAAPTKPVVKASSRAAPGKKKAKTGNRPTTTQQQRR